MSKQDKTLLHRLRQLENDVNIITRSRGDVKVFAHSVVYLSFRKFENKSNSSTHPHPCHCEPPQAAKQSPYRPGNCFASLAMTGDRGFFMAFGRLTANFLNA
jgi:hypothetical protein